MPAYTAAKLTAHRLPQHRAKRRGHQTTHGKLMMGLLGAVAEFENNLRKSVNERRLTVPSVRASTKAESPALTLYGCDRC